MSGRRRCECCGQLLPYSNIKGLTLRGYQGRIYDAVRAAGEGGIPTDQLVDHLYADRVDGGPLTAYRALYVTICRLNRKLARHGMRVTAPRSGGPAGNYGGYRLVRLAEPAATQ